MGIGLAVVIEAGGGKANAPIFNSFVEKRGAREGQINIHAGLRLLPKKRGRAAAGCRRDSRRDGALLGGRGLAAQSLRHSRMW